MHFVAKFRLCVTYTRFSDVRFWKRHSVHQLDVNGVGTTGDHSACSSEVDRATRGRWDDVRDGIVMPLDGPRSRRVLPGGGGGNGDGERRLETSQDHEGADRREKSDWEDDARLDGDLTKDWNQLNDIRTKLRPSVSEHRHQLYNQSINQSINRSINQLLSIIHL